MLVIQKYTCKKKVLHIGNCELFSKFQPNMILEGLWCGLCFPASELRSFAEKAASFCVSRNRIVSQFLPLYTWKVCFFPMLCLRPAVQIARWKQRVQLRVAKSPVLTHWNWVRTSSKLPATSPNWTSGFWSHSDFGQKWDHNLWNLAIKHSTTTTTTENTLSVYFHLASACSNAARASLSSSQHPVVAKKWIHPTKDEKTKTYSWCFRNPKTSTWDSYQNLVKSTGKYAPNLNCLTVSTCESGLHFTGPSNILRFTYLSLPTNQPPQKKIQENWDPRFQTP